MVYSTEIQRNSSSKNFLVVLNPAKIENSWTLDSGNVYYNDFSVSTKFLEYVNAVTIDGVAQASVSATPTSGEYWWDWANKRLYIYDAAPTTKTIVVFFEIHVSTKVFNTNRDPADTGTTILYFDPRLKSATIPQIDQDDIQVFGSGSGSLKLINSDGAFYVYDSCSFYNKNVKIYHVVNGEIKSNPVFQGKIQRYGIDDKEMNISYRSIDFIFNNSFNSYLRTGVDTNNGFFTTSDFPNLDPSYKNYTIRTIYGVVDDIAPVNIDFDLVASTTNNRDWVLRADADQAHTINNVVSASPTSTTTRIYLDGSIYYQVGDSIKVTISAVPEYTKVAAVGANYIDVLPAITAPSSGDTVDRSSIGYIKIKDPSGAIFDLSLDRDFTEQTFANNTLGFTLADNFEANHSGLATFNPQGSTIYCRCYGKKHATTNDSSYGNMTDGNLILIDILKNYAGLSSSELDETGISALSTYSLGFSIPDNLKTVFPKYRDIVRMINDSLLGQIDYTDEVALSYRLIGPLGATDHVFTDRDLLGFSMELDTRDIYNRYKVFYGYKEKSNGNAFSSRLVETESSDEASYLHEVSRDLDISSLILKQPEAAELAKRYRLIYENGQRIYSINTKVQLSESSTSSVIEIQRDKMPRYNVVKGTLQTTKMIISKIKKGLTNIGTNANDQQNLQDKSGDW